MDSLSKKRLALLEETVAFFKLDNLCMTSKDERGTCKYYIKGKAGCAIGRKIKSIKLKKELDANVNSFGGSVTGVGNDVVFNKLPKDLQELGQQFLKSIQKLHDTLPNWDENGISAEGLKDVEKIKTEFNLN